MNDHKQILVTLEENLIKSANKLHEIYNLVSVFDERNKQTLRDRVSEFDGLLKSMDDYCKSIDKETRNQLTLPLKVIIDIDKGYKPDSYGKSCIDEFKRNHKKDTLRHDGLKSLYDCICAEIKLQMDEELAKNIIGASQN